MLHYQQISPLPMVPKRIRVQTLELQQQKADHSSSVSVDMFEEEEFTQQKFRQVCLDLRYMALTLYFCFIFMIITQYETLIGIYNISVEPIDGGGVFVAISRSCTFIFFFPVYYILRRRPLKELVLSCVQFVILGQILNALSIFFGESMYFISSPLFSVCLTVIGFLPQRVATVWFFEKYRMQVMAVLYFAKYSSPSFVQILQKNKGVNVGFAMEQNLKFGLIFTAIILVLTVTMFCFLREPAKPVSVLALQPIEPIRQGVRGALCSSFFYKIALGMLCNYFAYRSKSRLNLKISSKGPYLHISQLYILSSIIGNLFGCFVILLLASKIRQYIVPVYKFCIICLFGSFILSSFILQKDISFLFNFIECTFYLLTVVISIELMYIVLQPLNPVYISGVEQQLTSLLVILDALIQYTTEYQLNQMALQIVITILCVFAIALLFTFRSPIIN